MKTVLTVIAIVFVLSVLFTEELYRYVFCRKGSKLFSLFEKKTGHDKGYYEYKKKESVRLRQIPCTEYTLHSDRGCDLKGFYYSCGAEGKRIAFVIHGYRSEHINGTAGYFDFYKDRGIDVFCCDHTASGKSGGNYIGFDVFESEDCLAWIDFLCKKFGHGTEIILHGFSMGGATVLQMSGHCPKNVKFIIADSAYMNAKAALLHQVGPLYPVLRLINKAVAHYDLNDSDVTESLRAASLPILFVHGKDDKLVPYKNGPALYRMYEGEKDFFFPEKTRHIEAMYTSEREYSKKIDSFIAKYLKD